MKEFTLRVQTDGTTTMNITLAETGNGVRFQQGFDGIWNAQGLRKLTASLRARRWCWRRSRRSTTRAASDLETARGEPARSFPAGSSPRRRGQSLWAVRQPLPLRT